MSRAEYNPPLINSILETINRSRCGLTALQLFNELELEDLISLRVYVSSLATRRGLLRTDGKRECGLCGSSHMVYRITDEGRMYLQGRMAA